MRRPAIRSLVGGAAGIAAGVIGGITLTSLSAAGLAAPGSPAPGLEASHVPSALSLPGEPVTLRYAILCGPREDGEPCAGSGEVYIRPGQRGQYQRIPLVRGDDSSEGRYFAEVPQALVSARAGYSYYSVLHDDSSGASVTVPAGGAAAPDRSFPLEDATQVDLGAHVFGAPRRADAHVLRASWGSDPGQAGLAGSRALGFAGPSSFDVGADGTVTLLDQVNRRAERWAHGRVETVALPVSGGLADFAVESDGTMDVLEPPNRVTPVPLLRSFRDDGTGKWAQRLADRTWAKLALGPGGPTVQQQPSEQWLPGAEHGNALDRGEQAARGRPGRPGAHGREVVVDRVGSAELRVAEVVGNAVLRSWRIKSATPLGEVQLVEPRGDGLVAVLKTYTDERAEYVVLVLRQGGAAERFSVEPFEWAESAPLARFRLAGSSLYQLGSTATGVFVDRFDLKESR
ncbi:MAG: hypothetical protein H0W90_00880 [Actinobacteria bacterium]|nr:hypothetical protein [Actinomycetota bacterium]